MPLPVEHSIPLNVPTDAFDEKGLCELFVSGGRYSGIWSMAVLRGADGPVLGRLTAGRRELKQDPCYPDLAVDTAFVWLMGEAAEHGWRVLWFKNLNSQYGPGERPYFVLAQVVIGSQRFKPKPGVRYADQLMPDDACQPADTGQAS
jgi:hypothetical protein